MVKIVTIHVRFNWIDDAQILTFPVVFTLGAVIVIYFGNWCHYFIGPGHQMLLARERAEIRERIGGLCS